MNVKITHVLIASVFPLLSACASTQPEAQTVDQILPESGYAIGPSVERIQQFRFNGWDYVDREHVIIKVNSSRQFLVGLRTNCDGLLRAHVIAFDNAGSFLTTNDTLLVQDNASISGPSQRCMIESMNELVRHENNALTYSESTPITRFGS